MTKNYMITFLHDRVNYYANIHEAKSSPAVYQVRIVAPFNTEIPKLICLAEENGRIVSDTKISDSLFDTLCYALKINC